MLKVWREGFWRTRGLLIAGLAVSFLLHSIVFLISYLLLPEPEQQTYRARLIPYWIQPERFDQVIRASALPASMEMLRRESEPATLSILSIPADTTLWTVKETVHLKQLCLVSLTDKLRTERVLDLKWIGPSSPPTFPSPRLGGLPDLQNGLFRMQDLDTGRYNSIIILDPTDRRGVTGYININQVRFEGQSRLDLAISNLVRYVRDHTHLLARIKGNIELSSPALFHSPVVFMLGDGTSFQLSSVEKENLGKYLCQGGFLFAESQGSQRYYTTADPFLVQMKAYLKQILGQGARFFKIPKTHSLYHSFYDFDDGPPLASALNYLEGVKVNGRLSVILSSVGLSRAWHEGKDARSLQFGVNLLFYVLTQSEGLATKVEKPLWLSKDVAFYEKRESFSPQRVPEPIIGCWLALIKTPTDEPISDTKLIISVDGETWRPRQSGEYNGILVPNLRPGEHQVKIGYARQQKELAAVVEEGKVSVVKFGLDRIFFLQKLRAKIESQPLSFPSWKALYGKLKVAKFPVQGKSQP